jgi:hypothetical protein
MGSFRWRNIPSFLIRELPEFNSLDGPSFREVIKRLLHLVIEEIADEGNNKFFIHPIVHERISARLRYETNVRYLTENIVPSWPEFFRFFIMMITVRLLVLRHVSR